VSTLPPVQSEPDFHRLTLNRQVLQTAVVPAVPMLTPRSTMGDLVSVSTVPHGSAAIVGNSSRKGFLALE
jgi:hypothetical protein